MSDFNKDQAKEKFVQQAGTGAIFQARFELSAKQKGIGLYGRGQFLTKSGEMLSISALKKTDKTGREYIVIIENEEQETPAVLALKKELTEIKASLKKEEPASGNDEVAIGSGFDIDEL